MGFSFTSKRHAVLTAAELLYPDKIDKIFQLAFRLKSPRNVFDALVAYTLLFHEKELSGIADVLALYIASYSRPMQKTVIDLFIDNGEAGALVCAKRKLKIPLEEREVSSLLISMIYLKKTDEKAVKEILKIVRSHILKFETAEKYEEVFNETLREKSNIPILKDEISSLEKIALSLD